MTEEYVLKMSDLCQSLTRDGKAVRVDIYGDGGDGWLLEVVDEHGNSLIWGDLFSSDQVALDEVLKSIEDDGIDSLIGPSSGTEREG